MTQHSFQMCSAVDAAVADAVVVDVSARPAEYDGDEQKKICAASAAPDRSGVRRDRDVASVGRTVTLLGQSSLDDYDVISN